MITDYNPIATSEQVEIVWRVLQYVITKNITRAELVEKTGLDDRINRDAIFQLKSNHGKEIISTAKSPGYRIYYNKDDLADVEMAIRESRGRENKERLARKPLERLLENQAQGVLI